MSLDPDDFGDLRLKGFARSEIRVHPAISKEETKWQWPLYIGGTLILFGALGGLIVLAMLL